jgi:hypothetical protein
MKQVGKKKLEQLKLDIRLRTVSNGYALDVNNEGFMYFDAQSLLEGFCIHVGIERLQAMTKGEVRKMLKATIKGSVAKMLQAEVTELRAQMLEQKKLIREQKREIRSLNIEH